MSINAPNDRSTSRTFGLKNPFPRLFLSGIFWMTALPGVTGEPERERTVNATFSSILWSEGGYGRDDDPVELYYRTGGRYRLLRSQIHQIGEPNRYKGPATMTLFERVKTRTENNRRWSYRPIQAVTIPDTTLFLLFLLAQNSGSEIRAAAINISEDAIPSGAIAFLNLTNKRVAADIRGDRQSVGPVQTALFRPLESESPDLPLKVAVFDEEWRGVFATVTRVRADRPYLMVFHTAGRRGDAYRLRTFRNLYQIRERGEQNATASFRKKP